MDTEYNAVYLPKIWECEHDNTRAPRCQFYYQENKI
jgi:hypothetical protein